MVSKLLALMTMVLMVISTLAQQKGPDPTAAALERDGPFAVQAISISNGNTPGFGAATIYAPTDTSQGSYAGISMFPGFTNNMNTMAWLARRMATHGFVVINCNTNGIFDFPASRGTQTLAALDYLANSSPVASLVDGNRLGAMGYSMGGGGALEAASDRSSLRAIVPLSPWNQDKTWGEVTVPTLIIGNENDRTAPVNSHAIPFYESVSGQKAYAEINNGQHGTVTSENAPTSKFSVAWMKRFLDNDTRYSQFVCPGPSNDPVLEEFRSSCSASRVQQLEEAIEKNQTAVIAGAVAGVVALVAGVAVFTAKRKNQQRAVTRADVGKSVVNAENVPV